MHQEITRFLEHLERDRGRSANTMAAYRNDLQQFYRFLNQIPDNKPITWPEVAASAIQHFMAHLTQDLGYASSTVARKMAVVKSFFTYLHTRGVIGHNPTLAVSLPKINKTPPFSIGRGAVERLLAAPDGDPSPKGLRDKALMEVLYATGMRVSELVQLNVSDVDLARKVVTCGAQGKRSRSAPVRSETVQALECYLREGRPRFIKNLRAPSKSPPLSGEGAKRQEDALFLNHRGARLTRQGLWMIIKDYANSVGIQDPVTPHTLRHSFAIHLLDAGAELQEVQERLGHASASTTQIYYQVSVRYQPGSIQLDDGMPLELQQSLHRNGGEPPKADPTGPGQLDGVPTSQSAWPAEKPRRGKGA